MAEALGIGEITLDDIISELEKARPGIPERRCQGPFWDRCAGYEGLKARHGPEGNGRNITDFGAFVDIGVHQDGLVHISEMSEKFIRHPLDAVSIGDIVDVKALDVNMAKRRIALSMKL